jgi:hypothetical protein
VIKGKNSGKQRVSAQNSGGKQHERHSDPGDTRLRGYQCKTVFVPEGTQLRAWNRSGYAYAEVVGDSIVHLGRPPEQPLPKFSSVLPPPVQRLPRVPPIPTQAHLQPDFHARAAEDSTNSRSIDRRKVHRRQEDLLLD